jgi:hypothetical protein
MRDAAAKGKEIDTPFNNNLPRPPNDVMVNPGNPDSNHWLLRVEFPSTAGCMMCIIEFLYNITVETRCFASSPRQVYI